MGPLRERYFIQKIVLFHTARHIYGINHDLLRLFFGKPSQCSGLFDYHSLSAVVFENAFNRCEPHKFIQQPQAGAVFSLWKQDKPSKAAQIKPALIAFLFAQRKSVFGKIIVHPIVVGFLQLRNICRTE